MSTDQRNLQARNLQQARVQLETLDDLIKTKTAELKQLRKEKKDAEAKIESLTRSLNNLGDHSFDAPAAKFSSDSFPWSRELNEKLYDIFSIQSFRGLQKTVINCTLSNNDCLYIAATGSGKSLVFQLPALISSGITIVISPLISLMDDQAAQLLELGIPSIVLNSSTSTGEYKEAMRAMIDENSPLKLLYVTPEKLAKSKSIMAQIEKMYLRGRFSRFVIDEVHCCSAWGHDFRPDYKFLSVFKRQFPETPIIGLTATATSEVINDIQKILNIEGCYVFKGSFYRPNLKYEVLSGSAKTSTITDMADLIRSRFHNQCGIIYCLSVKDTEKVAEGLTKLGITCHAYHAKLDINLRTRIQKNWYANKYRVIAATIAFGLGINKLDVRYVIHHSLSKSLENYYQETGRAGRDGKPAFCVCYYRLSDVFRATALTYTEKNGQKHVYQMLSYCVNRCECRKQLIADYFEDIVKKDPSDTQCCDNCCGNQMISKIDIRDSLEDLLTILEQAASGPRKEKLTANKILDAWTQKGPVNLRVEGLRKPALTRGECETVLGLLLADGFLREDFHFTQYAPISYILPGARAEFGLSRPLIYQLAIENPGQLSTLGEHSGQKDACGGNNSVAGKDKRSRAESNFSFGGDQVGSCSSHQAPKRESYGNRNDEMDRNSNVFVDVKPKFEVIDITDNPKRAKLAPSNSIECLTID